MDVDWIGRMPWIVVDGESRLVWLMTTTSVSGWMFLLIPAHSGCPGQNPQSHKMLVCVRVTYVDYVYISLCTTDAHNTAVHRTVPITIPLNCQTNTIAEMLNIGGNWHHWWRETGPLPIRNPIPLVLEVSFERNDMGLLRALRLKNDLATKFSILL